MTAFYQKRLSRHLSKMMKYMRYVFNDHFILVCVFLLGGLGFYYSQIIKTLPSGFIWGRPLVMAAWLLVLQLGSLATLAEEADKVFLLPKERQMEQYLWRAVAYSSLLPAITLLLLGGMTMPLVVISSGWSFNSFLLFYLMLVALKESHLLIQRNALYQNQSNQRLMQGVWLLLCLGSMAVGLYLTPFAGLGLALVQLAGFFLYLRNQSEPLDWEKMVRQEQVRMHRIYQFIHLFTDVPEITSSVKRRKFWDPLLQKVQRTSENTYFYLYLRSFLRGSEYSGLFFRLVVVAGVVLLLLQEFWIALGIAVLFIYLIGFQLIPIYAQFDYMIMTQLYPIPVSQKRRAVERLISLLLTIAAVLFAVMTMIALKQPLQAGAVTLSLAVEVVLFTKWYVPYRLKKMEG